MVTVKLLLENGADVNARGWYYKTPLHIASFRGSLEVSRLLIENGADIDAQDEEYQTPFQ
jgi:ankyrin repeat protein